jgi:hypothetical protein
MGFNSAQVSVLATGYTPLIVHGSAAGEFIETRGANGDELPVIIRNTDGTNPVYIGGTTVTTSNGFILKAGESLPMVIMGHDADGLCAVASGGTVVVAVLAGRQ